MTTYPIPRDELDFISLLIGCIIAVILVLLFVRMVREEPKQ